VKKIQRSVRREMGGSQDTIEKVQKAADEFERATDDAVPRGVTRVQVEKPKLDIRQYLWTSAIGAASAISSALIVLFLAYFLLASGDASGLAFWAIGLENAAVWAWLPAYSTWCRTSVPSSRPVARRWWRSSSSGQLAWRWQSAAFPW